MQRQQIFPLDIGIVDVIDKRLDELSRYPNPKNLYYYNICKCRFIVPQKLKN